MRVLYSSSSISGEWSTNAPAAKAAPKLSRANVFGLAATTVSTILLSVFSALNAVLRCTTTTFQIGIVCSVSLLRPDHQRKMVNPYERHPTTHTVLLVTIQGCELAYFVCRSPL